MDRLKILVSGASIAGPAAATLLTRQGHDVTIVERAAILRGGGQTVDLRGAGRDVIERMGLTETVESRLLDQRGIVKVDSHGRRGAAVPVTALSGNGPVSSQEILRGDLADVLVEASRADTEYVWDNTVTRIEQDAGGAMVTFERGEPRRFDLVIGADGLDSAVRRCAFGADGATFEPIGLQYAWFTANIDEDPDGWYLEHNAPGGLVASVRPSHVPGQVKAGLGVRAFDGPKLGDREGQWRWFADRYAGVGWLVPQLIEQMRTAPDCAYADLARVRMSSWTRGRVALVGDAGYCPTPLTGLGTTLALVGAYVLAGELAAADGDVPRALRGYDTRMRPIVSVAQELPPGGVAGYAPSSRLGIGLSALTYRTMDMWPFRRLWEALYVKADGIALPDYADARTRNGGL